MEELGETHADTASTLVMLAGVFELQHDYARAVEYYGRALKIQEAELGRDSEITGGTALKVVRAAVLSCHPCAPCVHRVRMMCVLCVCVTKCVTLRCLTRILAALSHSIQPQASIQSHQTDYYHHALEMYEKALAVKIDTCGELHPSTAVTVINIGAVYREQGSSCPFAPCATALL